MLDTRSFWNILMFGAILLWVAVIVAGNLLFESLAGKALLPVVLLLMHLGEIPISSGIGKAKGISMLQIVIHTVIFGFTWWVPLKRGVIQQR